MGSPDLTRKPKSAAPGNWTYEVCQPFTFRLEPNCPTLSLYNKHQQTLPEWIGQKVPNVVAYH